MPDPRALNVLIATADSASRSSLSAAVRDLGHDCATAEDGPEALDLFQRERREVVIADWQLPGLEAGALLHHIRSADEHVQVIVVIGEADAAVAREAIATGADEVVARPPDVDELDRRLISARRVLDLHARLSADARIDSLTGIPGRRAMEEDLELMLLRAARYGHELAAVLFDVDRFAGYHEAAGRTAGDDLLRRLAATLEDTLRGSDSLYRYGADEFLAVLPDQGTDSAAIAAERLRGTVEDLAFPHAAGGLVTVSAGVAALREGESSAGLLTRVDAALAEAKQAGRNCVRTAVSAIAQ